MHDGISAKINIQRCPQMIAQREVLFEASADRNTCCDSSHRVIRCMQKSNDMPQPGSPPNENKIRVLACFSCASIKVVCGLWFSCPSVGLETDRAKKQHPCGYQMVFRRNSLPALRAPFQPDWLAKQKETSTVPYGPAVPRCRKEHQADMEFDRCMPHIGLKVGGHLEFRRCTQFFNFRLKIRTTMMQSYKKTNQCNRNVHS